jgi:hypothetical protein
MALEREDRDRFDRASEAADAERLEVQDARRKNLTVQAGEDSRSRGARKHLDEERERVTEDRERRRQQREEDMDDDERAERKRLKNLKRKETEERQRKRQAEEDAVQKQHTKLNKEQAKKAANRLEYLFKQSPIFSKLQKGKGNMDENDNAEEKKNQEEEAAKKKKGRPARQPKKAGVHHIHAKESEEDDEDLEDDDVDQHVFLTQQPKCIKFGKMKPYQVESLNWMIHLAEKGLNGILADEVCKRIVNRVPQFVIPTLKVTRTLILSCLAFSDGSGKDFAEYCRPRLPLGIPQDPRTSSNMRPQVNPFQLDERTRPMVPIASSDSIPWIARGT